MSYGGSRGSRDLSCKVYVGNLPRDASEYEIERAFEKYGKLANVWVARNPPGFAFVEYEDPRDADDAINELDGRELCGERIRVEPSNGKVKPKPWLRGGRGGGGSYRGGRGGDRYGDDDRDRCYECGKYGHFAAECRSRRRSRSRSRDRSRRSPSYERRRSRSPRRD